ncbi:hypothetical protein PG987_008045 [Apiospora arundinis]
MLASQTLLAALAGTASAIDIFMHFSNNCGGNAIVCKNMPPAPGNCCSGHPSLDQHPTVGFYGIPLHWNINCRGWSGGSCTNMRESQRASNTNFVCLRNGWFSGAGYVFVNKKRSVETIEGDEYCPAQEAPCSNSVAPNALSFADGVTYSLVGLEGAAREQMPHFLNGTLTNDNTTISISIAASGANATAVPSEFDAQKME